MPESPPKPRILVVEDEPSILDNVLYALRSEGLDADGVSTGGEALERFAASREGGSPAPCDLVVLDVGLPDMTGFDVCRQLRRDHATPIIFLTARGAEVDRIVGLEIGGDDYVVKPFSPRELAARAKAVLRRLRPPSDADPAGVPPPEAPGDDGPIPVKGTPFAIDAARARITYCDRPLDLSSTEYRLLTTFCRRPGRVFSRSQLMDRAWEDPAAALERTVDAHVKSLRAKLKAVRPEPDPIVTHRGLGYSLREDW